MLVGNNKKSSRGKYLYTRDYMFIITYKLVYYFSYNPFGQILHNS